MKRSSQLVHFDAAPGDPNQPTSTPIYQTATFAQSDPLAFGPYDYSRSGNPTRAVLEQQLARLDGGTHAFSFASGMAAIDTVSRLVPAGGRIVAGRDLYGGTWRLLHRVAHAAGVAVQFVDTAHLESVAAAVAGADLLLLETPGNPMLGITDLAAVAHLCQANGCIFAVDSTLMTPLLQRPLEQGADLVIHSATKGLSGHSDLCAGAVVTDKPELAERLGFLQNATGTALGPFESWLLLRGMKTLSVRLRQQQSTAMRIAHWLQEQPGVRAVYYPGLSSHPNQRLHAQQAQGPGPLLSFTTGSRERSAKWVRALSLFTTAVSFGGVNSVASLPCRMSHASIPEAHRNQLALPEDLVRLSIGIEDPDDLLADLAISQRILTENRPTPTASPTLRLG
jgi:cystathionine beta-lyase